MKTEEDARARVRPSARTAVRRLPNTLGSVYLKILRIGFYNFINIYSYIVYLSI